MKTLKTLTIGWLLLCLVSGCAHTNRKPGGTVAIGTGTPRFNGSILRLMGENPMFTARLENEIYFAEHKVTLFLPGNITFDNGKSRFELDRSEIERKLNLERPGGAIHTGTETMVTILRPDKRLVYRIYPELKVYSEEPDRHPTTSADGLTLKFTELGRETLDGHPCVKSKVVGRDGKGQEEKSVVWTATDLKNFPIRIESATDPNTTATMQFKELHLGAVDPALFEPPADFKRYDPLILRQEVAKRAGGETNSLPSPPK